MNKNAFYAATGLVGALSLGLIAAYLGSAAPRAVAQTPQTTPKKTTMKTPVPSPALLPSAEAPAVVDAANAFLTTLSDKQRTTVQVALSSENAARWSNFPAAVVPRNGVYFRDLTPAQTAAALKVAQAALSKEGFSRFQEVRLTDEAFGKSDEAKRGPGGGQGGPGGPPPGGFGGPGRQGGPGGPGGFGGNLFGTGNYIIAFLGKPSKTEPWMLQIGGHHLAFNIYYKGTMGTATPYFVGAQPNVWKDASGKTHAPLAPMRDAMYDLLHSLTPTQLTQAKLASNFSDVLVGPSHDGRFPTTQDGVPVTALSTASQAQVKRAIAAWTGDTAQGAAYRKRYDAELTKTTVSYSGTTAVATGGDYVRIAGPHVWIEFVCQGSDHYHTIWRDRTTDYGAEFSF